MTPPISLTDLAERVSRLTRPCRETDALIWAVLNGYAVEYRANGLVLAKRGDDERRLGFVDPTPRTNNFYTSDGFFAPVTASLDAAMMLMPKGWFWTLCQHPVSAKIWTDGNVAYWVPRGQTDIRPATPILALLVAILLARAASENSHG